MVTIIGEGLRLIVNMLIIINPYKRTIQTVNIALVGFLNKFLILAFDFKNQSRKSVFILFTIR